MVLEKWAKQQEESGNDDAAGMARLLASKYGDMPVPVERVSVVPRSFTSESRQSLEAEGYNIYTLTGHSLKSLVDQGRKFCGTWFLDQDFSGEQSMISEVAFRPDAFIITRTDTDTFSQIQADIETQTGRYSPPTSSTSLVIGGVADYAELIFKHYDMTGMRVFGRDYGYVFARTTSNVFASVFATIGFYDEIDGPIVSKSIQGVRLRGTFAAPLVVPSSSGLIRE